MFFSETVLGKKIEFRSGLIVAKVSEVDEINVRLNFGYDYEAVIPKEEFSFDIKKGDKVNIKIQKLSSLTGPVADFAETRNVVSISLKRERIKKNLNMHNKHNRRTKHVSGKKGWNYYFEIVEPNGILKTQDVLFVPDYFTGLFKFLGNNNGINSYDDDTISKYKKTITKKGIEIITEYESKNFISLETSGWKEHLSQDDVFTDNVSIFMDLNNGAEISKFPKSDYLDLPKNNMETKNNNNIELKRICDIPNYSLGNIEVCIEQAKSSKEDELTLIKCRTAISYILKEIIKNDKRINYDQYSQMSPGEILHDEYINNLFSENIILTMKKIIKLGNHAAHEIFDSTFDYKNVIADTEDVFSWFKLNYRTFQ